MAHLYEKIRGSQAHNRFQHLYDQCINCGVERVTQYRAGKWDTYYRWPDGNISRTAGECVPVSEHPKPKELPEQLTLQRCQCDYEKCSTYGFSEGAFPQGAGFEKDVAQEVARRYNEYPALKDYVERAKGLK